MSQDTITASEWKRLSAWFADPNRKPSSTAFTAGAARDAASAYEFSQHVKESDFDIRRIPGHDQPQGVHVPTYDMMLPAVEATSRKMVLEIARFVAAFVGKQEVDAVAAEVIADAIRKEYL